MVDEPIRLDLSEAFAAIDQLYVSFIDQAVAAAAEVSSTIQDQLSSIDASIAVDAALGDPNQLSLELDTAIGAADTAIDVELANPDDLSGQVADALEAGAASADVSPAASGGGGGEPDPGGGGAGGFLNLASAANLAKGAAAGAKGEIAGVGAATQGLAGAAGPAVAGVGALVGVLGEAFKQAQAAQQGHAQLTRVLGDEAAAVEHINFGGIDESLDSLTGRLGSNNDTLRISIANFAQLGVNAGKSTTEIAQQATQFATLAAYVAATRPQLGSVSDIMDQLPRRIARGGPFLAQFGLSITSAQIAAEALAQGITKPVSELSIYERATIAATVITRQLGDTMGTAIGQGADLSVLKVRSMREQIRRELEQIGEPLLNVGAALGGDLLPAVEGIVHVIGAAGAAIVGFLEPIVRQVGPQLGAVFSIAGVAVEALVPVLHIAGEAIGLILKPTTLLTDQLQRLAGFVHDNLPEAFHYLEREGAKAVLFLVDAVNSLIGAFNKVADHVPGLDSIKKIDTTGLDAVADGTAAAASGLDAVGAAATTASDGVNRLTDDMVAQVSTHEAIAAQTRTTEAGYQALLDKLTETRGISDQAFFALLKLGNDGGRVMQDLALGIEHGGLSMEDFARLAHQTGLSLDDLAAIEAKVRQQTEDFKSGVAKAIGDVTDATKELDDKGKANITDFVTEMAKQALDAAAFANSIQTLFARGADDLANALLAAGPAAAGAAAQAAKSSDEQLAHYEDLASTTVKSFDESKTAIDQYATTAVQKAGEIKTAFASGGPEPDALSGDVDTAILNAEAAFTAQKDGAVATAQAVGEALVTGVATGMRNAQAAVNAAAADTIDGALLSAQSAAEIKSPSRLFSRDVGFPLTEGVAEGILGGMFKVEDAIGDVIAGAQQHAQQQLDTVFGALGAGQAVANAQSRVNDLNDQYATLAQRQVDLPGELADAQQKLNRALTDSQAITAREQQAIERAQDNLDKIREQLKFQTTTGPQQLDQAQRSLAGDAAEAARLHGLAITAADNAALGTGTDADARTALQAFNDAQRQVEDSQKAVDDLTSKLADNRVTQADLQVAVEDLAQAQSDATGPTSALADAQQHLKDVQADQVQVNKDLLDVTNQLPAAQLAVLEATARAAAAGEAFNKQGLAGLDILKGIAEQAGYSDTAIAQFTKTWAGLASTISTSLGGGAFGAPQGMVDIGSILGLAPDFQDPQTALDRLNFVRGLSGQGGLSMSQAPWNVNIYQANDPVVLSGTLSALQGLAGVR